MSIVRDIQEALFGHDANLGAILLKLRFLASRLGSEPLEDWVKYEAEGYPRGVDVPTYRKIAVSYKGTWSGPAGAGIRNAPIPPHLIQKFANESWVRHEVRESIAGVEEFSKSEELSLDASNLILVLQGKMYEGYACNSVTGIISPVAMKEITQTVRNRILELTLELEKRVPEAVEVTLGKAISQTSESEAAVSQIVNNIVYGNVTNVNATDNAHVSLSIAAGDINSMISELAKAGLPQQEAQELAEIIATEEPAGAEKPLGKKALTWIMQKAPKAASGAWKIGSNVLTSVATEAALKYYGLKP